jgi:HEPN domain-containing protein
MNKNDLQQIALIRLKEAKTLLDAGHYGGAYYLSGYAIECALKACIAKQTKRYDFPNKKIAVDSYTHDLTSLMKVARLQTALDQEMRRDAIFAVNWAIVKDWTVDSRYEMHSQKAAEDIYSAISNKRHGVLRWLKRHW